VWTILAYGAGACELNWVVGYGKVLVNRIRQVSASDALTRSTYLCTTDIYIVLCLCLYNLYILTAVNIHDLPPAAFHPKTNVAVIDRLIRLRESLKHSPAKNGHSPLCTGTSYSEYIWTGAYGQVLTRTKHAGGYVACAGCNSRLPAVLGCGWVRPRMGAAVAARCGLWCGTPGPIMALSSKI
jgi:hypothetical protein